MDADESEFNTEIAAGADCMYRDKHGFTPLHRAALEGRTSMLVTLLQQHTCINDATDNDGLTAL